MDRPTLMAKVRTVQGSRGVRRLRREGLIPGVVYGKTTAPLAITVSHHDLLKFLHARAGAKGVVTLRVEADPAQPDGAKSGAGGKPWEKPVLIKQVEQDPVRGDIVHIEFHAVTLTEHIRVKVPVILNGTPIGVKQENGVLEHFLREIEVACLPTDIPKEFQFDVSGLNIGDTVHVRDLAVPAGVKITTDLDAVIISVQAPKAEKLEEAAPEVTEPEVIREKKPEAGEAGGEAEGAKKPEGKKEDAKKEEKKPEK